MKADNQSTPHNRTIRFSEIPDEEIHEMDVTINYTGQGNAGKGVVIDSIIVPYIMNALKIAKAVEEINKINFVKNKQKPPKPEESGMLYITQDDTEISTLWSNNQSGTLKVKKNDVQIEFPIDPQETAQIGLALLINAAEQNAILDYDSFAEMIEGMGDHAKIQTVQLLKDILHAIE